MNFSPTTQKVIDTGALGSGAASIVVGSLHEYDALGWISTPWVEQIPAADHASSMEAGFAFGLVAAIATERIATRLDTRGHEKAGEIARQLGKIVTMLGSLASQITVETTLPGVSDKWDVVAGVAATVPGIITGQFLSRIAKKARQQAS